MTDEQIKQKIYNYFTNKNKIYSYKETILYFAFYFNGLPLKVADYINIIANELNIKFY